MRGLLALARSKPGLALRSTLRPYVGYALVILAILAAAVVPFFIARPDVLNALFLILLYVCLGQSWNILGGFAGQTNLGHAAFFGTGALVTRTLWIGGVPFPLAFLAGGIAAVVLGLAIGIPTFRLRGAYFAIGTLAVAEALRITIGNVLPFITTLPVEQIVSYDLGLRYHLALALAIATTATAWGLLRSRLGLGLFAIREDETAAEATGVSPLRHKLMALALSSFFAGLAGGLFAYHQVGYYPSNPFGPNWTFDAVLVVFVGGVGTLIGPILGSIFYVVVRELLATNLVSLHQILFGALFIVIVLALPGGLVDAWSRAQRLLQRPAARAPSEAA